MSAPPLHPKFVRSFTINTSSIGADGCMGWILRLAYEFWGFCVNGDNNLVKPGLGSMANSQATGSYINMPVGWESGSIVLLASGSDGTTTAGSTYFNVTGSQPFSPNVAGKWLTMWQSGSTSTDDSIYLITQWVNSSSIAIDPTYGGTPAATSGTLPQLTTRSNINYRVIDYGAAALMSYPSGSYFVAQFSSAADVNPGQARSQVQFLGLNAQGNITRLTLVLSPSGSWNGTSFAGLGENNFQINPEVTAGPGHAGWGTADWFHGFFAPNGSVNLIGDRTFLICQAGSTIIPVGSAPVMMGSAGAAFHVEIPIRLYPQANDPNPICAGNWGNVGVFLAATVGYGFGHRFFPSPYDTSTQRWPVLTRAILGSGWNGNVTGGSQFTPQYVNINRYPIYHNQYQNTVLASEGILSLNVSGQFSLARARLRSARFTSGNFPYYARFTQPGDSWIHIGGGVLWPWDNAVSARPLFQGF